MAGMMDESMPEAPDDRSFQEFLEESGGRFTDWLRERSEPEWTAAVHHPFTDELGRNELDRERFAEYLVQDLDFVDTLVGAFGYLIGQVDTMETRSRVAQFLATVTSDENDYFERSLDALDVSQERLANTEPNRVNAEFQSFLEDTVEEGSLDTTLAVLLPVEWVYAAWAEEVSGEQPEPFYFQEWIDLHHNPAFNDFVNHLRERMDDIGPELSPERQETVAERFTQAVEYEVAFFDAVYGA
jgi:thiaminase/transcriptional activator TenA